jgi:ADP-ribose pyrophosphatase YjhB (NUDIX family)
VVEAVEKRHMKKRPECTAHHLEIARRLLAIAQNGLHFSEGPYDRERYQEIVGLAEELVALTSDLPKHELRSWFQAQQGYATPKIDVRGVVFEDDKILLVREGADGRWTLPGGWCDLNYSPRENVEKEVWEEAGLTVKATKLLALYDKRKHQHPPEFFHSYKLFFLCEKEDGLLRPNHETLDVRFFSFEDLPQDISEPRTTTAQIQKMFTLKDTVGLTEFD